MSKTSTNKVALITGGNRGIGFSLTSKYLESNYTVYATYRESENSKDLLDIAEQNSNLIPVCLDVRNEPIIKKAVSIIATQEKRLDVLVCNAGINLNKNIGFYEKKEILDLFEINAVGNILLIQQCLRLMIRKKSGSIIVIGSTVASKGNPGQSAYAASKGALESFVYSAAKEIGVHGVRINLVCPGIVETRMADNNLSDIRKNIPLGRNCTPDDVAQACLFLSSEGSSFITGQNLFVDGSAIY